MLYADLSNYLQPTVSWTMIAISDIRQAILDLSKSSEKIKRFAQHHKDGPLTRQNLLSALLWEYDPSAPHATPLLDYAAWSRFYPSSATKVHLTAAGKSRIVSMPYEVNIDFTQHPHTRISVEEPVTVYEMPTKLQQLTERNLEEYQRLKSRTFNGRVTRLAKLEWRAPDQYAASIQLARYWDQARTNLSLDIPVRTENDSRSLRERDLGPGGKLLPFQESILLNSIGVSAVVGARDIQRRWRFFCKLRRKDDSIAEKMLSTASGVAELVPGQHVRDLLSYAESEIIREVYNETGLSCDAIVRLVPLVFCRELVRGGKPQFMFFIEFDSSAMKEFPEKFKLSAEGLDEFYDSWYSSITAHGNLLSYEFAFNLCLAWGFLQQESHQQKTPIALTH